MQMEWLGVLLSYKARDADDAWNSPHSCPEAIEVHVTFVMAKSLFTDEDVQRLLSEERGEGEGAGWSLVSRQENCEVWKKSVSDSPMHIIKGFLMFPGIPYTEVVDMITDLKRRPEWDQLFITIDVLEENEDHKVVFWRAKMPLGVVDRTLIQQIKHIDDKENNVHYILYKNYSGDHPNAPNMSGTVRAETIFSGVIIRPDAERPNSTRLSIFFQNDMKGWVPTFLVNMFARKAPVQWMKSLNDYHSNSYRKD